MTQSITHLAPVHRTGLSAAGSPRTAKRPIAFALTIQEVTEVFNHRHGTHLSRARIWQIMDRAEKKIRAALAEEES